MGSDQSCHTLGYLLTGWPRQDPQEPQHFSRRAKAEAWTARRVAFLFVARREALTPEQITYLAALQEAPSDAGDGISVGPGVRNVAAEAPRGAAVQGLDHPGPSSEWPERRIFAKGLLSDQAAVEAGLTLPWSAGSVEGHIL
jgi:hypothetical protein